LFSVILTVTLNPSLDRTYLLGPLLLDKVNRDAYRPLRCCHCRG